MFHTEQEICSPEVTGNSRLPFLTAVSHLWGGIVLLNKDWMWDVLSLSQIQNTYMSGELIASSPSDLGVLVSS